MIREKDAALAKAIAFEAEAKAGFPIDHDISLFLCDNEPSCDKKTVKRNLMQQVAILNEKLTKFKSELRKLKINLILPCQTPR